MDLSSSHGEDKPERADGKKIHVMHFVSALTFGGAEYGVVVNLLNSLDASRFRCTVASMSVVHSEVLQVILPHIEVVCFNKNKKSLFFILFDIIRYIRNKSVDIVHTHNWPTYFFGYCSSYFTNSKRLFHTEHGRDVNEFVVSSKKYYMQKVFLHRTNKLITVSEDIKKSICSIWKLKIGKVITIQNGINTDKYKCDDEKRKEIRKKYSINEECLVIGNVSVFRDVKNHPLLLRAFKEVLEYKSDLILFLVGGDPRDVPKTSKIFELQKMVCDLDIEDKVHFLGERLDVPDLMKCFDVYVNMSLFEGTSITILEAMASCLPVVASNVGGNPELVEQNKSGLLFSSNNCNELIDRLKLLVSDSQCRKRMGLCGAEIVKERFSLDKMVKEYTYLYEDCKTV